MKLPIYQIDAFTRRRFGGNPAAVVLLQDWLPDPVLRAIAAENNLSETAYVIPRGEVMPLRWFTPTVEVDLCGHATLATAHVLFRHHRAKADRLTFSTRSGNLSVARAGDRLSLDFPARPGTPAQPTEAIRTALGAQPRELWRGRDLLAVFETEEEIKNFQPDFARIAALDEYAVTITAPGRSADYVYRFFAPSHGIPEDPVTGSANCLLVPYWAKRLGKKELTAQQLSARGGELFCTLEGERVLIAGHTVEYLQGEITVDA